MKNFNKWYSEFDEPVSFDEDQFRYEAGWKAALEWVEGILKREATYPKGTSGYELAEDVKEVIKEELNE